MPQEFDPTWEYYSPDPEVEEILADTHGMTGMDLLPRYRDGETRTFSVVTVKRVEPTQLSDTHLCEYCKKNYVKVKRNKCCSRSCARRGSNFRPVTTTPKKMMVFRKLWVDSSLLVWEIQVALKISPNVVAKWRKALGLLPGNKRSGRCEATRCEGARVPDHQVRRPASRVTRV